MHVRPYRIARVLLLAAIAGAVAGCGDNIVYRDNPNVFEAPLTGAGEFLGYSDVASKRTTCGNCHVGKQAEWQQTAHASAFSSLTAAQAAGTCGACHTVNSLGNLQTADNDGWLGAKNPRYQDVQCESCHGPGLTHVSNPDIAGTKPLASLAVSTTLKRGCGECHSGAHQPFVEDWAASRHGRVTSRLTNPDCKACHGGIGALQTWGVKSTFLEEMPGVTDPVPITCATCHDPHDKRNPAQLRYPIDTPNLETNLCMKCHYRRAAPEVASSSGPHSPQGPLLLGEAGWVPPNFTYPAGSLVGTHGSDKNPKLCAGCHVNSYTVTDKLTGAFQFRSTGHSFQALPCVVDGQPTAAWDCPLEQKSFAACATCHLSENGARSALAVTREEIARYAAQVQALEARIPASEFSTTDNRISTAEGSKFNRQLALERGSAAHNPYLIKALLLASIRQIELDYGLRPAAMAPAESQQQHR